MIEKILIKIPRISGKIERFYGIIEEALYGKDPYESLDTEVLTDRDLFGSLPNTPQQPSPSTPPGTRLSTSGVTVGTRGVH